MNLDDILMQNVAIRGFESINGDGEYFGNLDEASVDKLFYDIQQLIANQVREARLDEVKSLSDTFDTMHQKTEGGGFVHYGEFGEYLDDRIAALKGVKK